MRTILLAGMLLFGSVAIVNGVLTFGVSGISTASYSVGIGAVLIYLSYGRIYAKARKVLNEAPGKRFRLTLLECCGVTILAGASGALSPDASSIAPLSFAVLLLGVGGFLLASRLGISNVVQRIVFVAAVAAVATGVALAVPLILIVQLQVSTGRIGNLVPLLEANDWFWRYFILGLVLMGAGCGMLRRRTAATVPG